MRSRTNRVERRAERVRTAPAAVVESPYVSMEAAIRSIGCSGKEVARMKTLLATTAVSVLLLAACGTAGGTGATKVDATSARTVNATLTDSKIVLDKVTVPSGKITFLVSNAGTMTHEVVVLKTDVAADKIAPNPDEPGKMSEDGSQGESGDLDPTQKTTFTLDLVPGNYVLICNQPAHYLLGMHIAFTVK